MIQKVNMQLNLSSYNKLQSKMIVFKKQIITMREIAEQLLAMKLSLDHDWESLDFEQGFQKMVNNTFNLLVHGQDIDIHC